MVQSTVIPILDQRVRRSAGLAFDTIQRPGVRSSHEGSPPFSAVRSLYIHVPFCFHKCHYCDFYSIVDTRDRQQSFLSRLESELQAVAPWAAGRPLKTIFVGGGTPSLLRVDLWGRLLARLAELFDLSLMHKLASTDPAGEFTVECNPETVAPELMSTLKAGGVTRVSVGAQSFNERHLKTLERWHNPENVGKALGLARDAGITRQSIDLIFGIPGQSLEDWRHDLDTALALGTEHVSCYNLTYEPQTAMTARLKRGEFAPADEDAEVEMFNTTLSTLRAAGIERYEVSNFARPGAECRHNLAYWRQESWLAVGPSASAHVGGHRWKNVPRLDDYLEFSDRGFSAMIDHEPPDPRRALAERIMTGLRLREGIDEARLIADASGINPRSELALRIARDHMQRAGHVTVTMAADEEGKDAARWSLTDAGFMLADGLACDLMACLDA